MIAKTFRNKSFSNKINYSFILVVFYTEHVAYLLDYLVCYETMAGKNLAMCRGELSVLIYWLTLTVCEVAESGREG